MTPQETLRKAAEYIEQHGWCQKTKHAVDGRVCVMGAIEAVTDFDMRSIVDARTRFTDFVRALDWVWNDTPGRRQEDVIAALRAAAE